MEHIIINADDFGKSPDRNRAINDAFRLGLINSAGMIVTGWFMQDAVNQAVGGGYLNNLHLHINLSANLLHENSNDVPLTELMKKDPCFCKDGKFLKYRGLPKRISSIRKWKVVYQEMVAQFELFKKVTQGKGNYKHIDFHLWYNLTWPVSLALNHFTRRYKIESVRYYGVQQKSVKKYILYRLLSWNPRVKYFPSTNIDYYLSKRGLFDRTPIVELYCHPNYRNNMLLDDSPSYLGNKRQSLLNNVAMLTQSGVREFISWEEV